MLKHFLLLSCLLGALMHTAQAQQPTAVYAEVGVTHLYRDMPFAVRVGLNRGRHDMALEFGFGKPGVRGAKGGLRYRFGLPEQAAHGRVLPFVQAGLSVAKVDFSEDIPLERLLYAHADLSTGLQVGLWKGLRISGHVGLRFTQVIPASNGLVYVGLGSTIYPVGGLGLAYALPSDAASSVASGGAGHPASGSRHEIGLGISLAHVTHVFPYSDVRLQYAYRVHPHWDLRAAVDLPTWPVVNGNSSDVGTYWRPGLYAGARYWAAPDARFAVFAQAGLMYAHRYLPWFSDFLHRNGVLEPEMGAGIRARIGDSFGVELSSHMRLMPYRGVWLGLSDNVMRVGLSYRFGR